MSQWWKDMYVGEETNDAIISKEKPIAYDSSKKNFSLIRGEIDIDKVSEFIGEQNQMTSGNWTLLPSYLLKKYLDFNGRLVTIRANNSGKILGTILSTIFDVKCNEQIIKHGCTSFLTLHKALRGHGVNMALIRELISWGWEDQIYCDYHTVAKPVIPGSIKIHSWFRPLNMLNSLSLGFEIPDWNIPTKFIHNRTKYYTKAPKKCKIIRVTKNNCIDALCFWRQNMTDKTFVFWPDSDCMFKWVEHFPTYLVRNKETKKYIGLFSMGEVYCKMISGMEGRLLLPLIFTHTEDNFSNVFKCLVWAGKEEDFDLVYIYQIGDFKERELEKNNCVKLDNDTWFSLYNNGTKLRSEDIYAPLI